MRMSGSKGAMTSTTREANGSSRNSLWYHLNIRVYHDDGNDLGCQDGKREKQVTPGGEDTTTEALTPPGRERGYPRG